MKNWIWIIVAVVVIGGLWWWGSNQSASTAVTGPVKVGVILPLTGDGAVYGEPLSKVLQLAVGDINAAGGINGNDMQLVIEDGKCNGQDGANAAQKLINVDKVAVIIGGLCSSESLAAAPIADAAKVPMLSPWSSSPKLTGVSKYFARNYPSDSAQGKVLADIAYNDKGWKTVAFIQEQTDYAQGVYDSFKAEFEKLGGKTTDEAFPTETSDFRSIVSKVKAGTPDAVFVDTQTPAVSGRIFTQMQQLGWAPHLLVADIVPGDPATVSKYATFLEGTLAAEFGVDPSNQTLQKMISEYKAKYGEEPPYQGYAQTTWDAAYLVHDAVMASGLDGTKIAEWFHTKVNGYQGAAGAVTIGSDGDLQSAHRPEVIMGGKVVPYVK